jgi:hypothetical protein
MNFSITEQIVVAGLMGTNAVWTCRETKVLEEPTTSTFRSVYSSEIWRLTAGLYVVTV